MRKRAASTSEPIPALQLLQQAFPGRLRLTNQDLATALGLTPGTVRTLRCRGSIPLELDSDRRIDICDVADYIETLRAARWKRGAGAPTKVEQAEAARLGLSVKELRAQRTLELGGAK